MTDETNATLDAALQRYAARVGALNDQKIDEDVTVERTFRGALVGMPVTFDELRPMLKTTVDAALERVLLGGALPAMVIDVYAQGLLLGYIIAQEEARGAQVT